MLKSIVLTIMSRGSIRVYDLFHRQVATVGSDGDSTSTEDDDNKKRREILARRPSYRSVGASLCTSIASDMFS